MPIQRYNNYSQALCTGRRFLVLTTALCICWLTMDFFLFYSGPPIDHSDSDQINPEKYEWIEMEMVEDEWNDVTRGRETGRRKRKEAETERSALLFEDLLDRERRNLLLKSRKDIRTSDENDDLIVEQHPDDPVSSDLKEEEAMNDLIESRLRLVLLKRVLGLDALSTDPNARKEPETWKQLFSNDDTRHSISPSETKMKPATENLDLNFEEMDKSVQETYGSELSPPQTSKVLYRELTDTSEKPLLKNDTKASQAHYYESMQVEPEQLSHQNWEPLNKTTQKTRTISENTRRDTERLPSEKNKSTIVEVTTETYNTMKDKDKRSLVTDTNDVREEIDALRGATSTETTKYSRTATKNEDSETNNYVRVRDYNARLLPFDTNGPGEYGQPVRTSVFEQKRVEALWNLSYFNQLASDKISVERSIPDTRHPDCKDKLYNYSVLQKVSVIICFTDEWWSALVRSVHSVLDRTPPELLQEILLLDDFSQRQDLKDPLGSYLGSYSKIRLIHLPERHGLIRARMVGVSEAKAPVVVFLDSHVECNRGWLEPLLEAIHRNPKSIVSPIIDGIDSMDFQYKSAPDSIRGGFSWNLQFQWKPIPPYEVERRSGDPTSSIRTPTIAGGLFAVNRQYFQELGQYDPGLDVWGAENMELSFKTWMCGGSLEIIPCSRVGHVFRSGHPYSFPGKAETFRRNAMRVADVWLDSYRDVIVKYYPQFADVITGDVTDQVQLRKMLRCESFDWYIENVYPELYVPTAVPVAWGELVNLHTQTCMDRGKGGFSQVYPCHGRMDAQYFQLTGDGRLEVFTECIGLYNDTLRTVDCNQMDLVLRFNHAGPGTPVVDIGSGLCVGIDPKGEKGLQRLRLTECRQSRRGQKWSFTQYRHNNSVNDTYTHNN